MYALAQWQNATRTVLKYNHDLNVLSANEPQTQLSMYYRYVTCAVTHDAMITILECMDLQSLPTLLSQTRARRYNRAPPALFFQWNASILGSPAATICRMFRGEILSRPNQLHMEENVEPMFTQKSSSNGITSSTYSHYDSGISPDGYHTKAVLSSPDEHEPRLQSLRRASYNPVSHSNHGSMIRRGSSNYHHKTNGNGHASVVMISSATKTSDAQSPYLNNRCRRSNSVRNCVLCLLIFLVFIFALVVALFLGHWANEGYITQLDRTGSSTPTFSLHRNLTVLDVYPPTFVEDYAPAIHRTSALRSPQDPIIALPKNVMPVHYDLNLDFSELFTAEHIHGNVSILFESFGNSSDNEVVLHAASNIFIHRLRIRHDGQPMQIKSVKRQFKRDLVRVQMKQRLKATWYTIEIEFRTRICQSPFEGAQCIRSSVPNSTAEVISSFTTKFEPMFARTFLPCWDEPRIKTTFNVSIKHPANTTVLTNVSPQSQTKNDTDADGVTHYVATHKMPVYLLAFVVGDFVSLETRTDRNMPLTLWTSAERASSAHFAANFSPAVFDRVEEEFGVLYPMSKMDFVAAKGFPVGGMENWGLVIFNENAILMPPGYEGETNSTVDGRWEQYKIEKIVAHEIVHQWFGNLVTMADWPELWLNEGFASYFVYDFLNDDHPHLTDNEYYIRLIELLDRQTSTSRVPLVRKLETMDEVDKMFDGLQLYTKGSVVVKMIKDLLGPIEFKAGISRYLKKNAFKSVSSDSLWASLPTFADHGAENEKLADVIEPWLINEGMPEVIISRNYEDHTIRITQRVSDQNRYIIYLNDASFQRDSPNSKHKRDTDDVSLEYIESDDHLQEMLDKETDILQRVAKSVEDQSELLKSASAVESVIFDETMFSDQNTAEKTQSTETGVTSRSQDINHRKTTKNVRKGSRRRQKTKPRLNPVKPQTPETNASASQNKNKVSLFSNTRKQTKIFENPNQRVVPLSGLRSGSREDFEGHQRRQLRHRIPASPTTWSIPFSYWFGSTLSSEGQIVRQFWVHNETIRFVDAELNPEQYILANPHWVYPFKINYDLDNWKMLINQLHKNPFEIATMSRAQLIIDAQTYLKQSGVPYLYLKLLKYLSQETDLGVLLVGLDAVHSTIDLFSATVTSGPLLVYFTPVIQQFDRVLEQTSTDAELAAVWLLSPQRLSKLYQLRCIANFGSCQQNQQMNQWLSFPTALTAEHHQQITAICHYLFTQGGPREVTLLSGLLRQMTTQWPVVVQLATCVRDETLIEEAVARIVKSRNAAIYATVLQSSYSIQYNRKFREVFWKGISDLNLHERRLLFAVNTGKSDRIAQLLLHSVRSSEELEAVVQLVPEWPINLQVHIDFVRRKYAWIENTAVKQIQNFLIQESAK
uniref:Peptidase_M1 domain-containing protein n=1 Tax=Panagrellus redivivus TaxID=6233 RepID=A0A7E4W0V3_PANRE